MVFYDPVRHCEGLVGLGANEMNFGWANNMNFGWNMPRGRLDHLTCSSVINCATSFTTAAPYSYTEIS